MSTSDRIAELKALQATLEGVADAENAAADAKAAYRNDPTPENKEAHRAAGRALAEARDKVRSPETLRTVAPGDVSITPATVGKD